MDEKIAFLRLFIKNNKLTQGISNNQNIFSEQVKDFLYNKGLVDSYLALKSIVVFYDLFFVFDAHIIIFYGTINFFHGLAIPSFRAFIILLFSQFYHIILVAHHFKKSSFVIVKWIVSAKIPFSGKAQGQQPESHTHLIGLNFCSSIFCGL